MRKVRIENTIGANVSQPSKVSGSLTGMTSAVFGYIGGDPKDQTNLVELIDSKVATGSSSAIEQERIQRIVADQAEAAARVAADQSLQNNILIEKSQRIEADSTKVDKVAGKGLSTNDYSNSEKAKVASAIQPADISDMATKTWTNAQGFLKEHQSLANYDTKAEVNSKISVATNDMATKTWTSSQGYLTEHQSLANYSTTAQMNAAISAYHDSTKQDVINDLSAIRTNATKGGQAKDVIDTYGNIVTHNTSDFATAAQGAKADSAVQPSAIVDMATKTWSKEQVINSIASTTVDQPLSANMGKELQDQINNLKSRGRYLSVWNCTTGLAETEPTVNPYTYKSGDFFIVGTVGTTNYKPNGSTYDKTIPSTTVESGDVKVNDTYYYDGSVWGLLHTETPIVAFSTLAGSPYDNTNLSTALNSKQSTIDSSHKLSSDLVDDTNHTNKFVTALEKTSIGTAIQPEDNITKLTNDAGYVTSSYHDSTKQDTLPQVVNNRYLHTNSSTGALEWSEVSSVSPVWGSITGTLSNQTDLNSALSGKQSSITQSAKLSSDLVDDVNHTNKFVTENQKTAWNNKVDSNVAITGATKTKITYDSKGLVTAGADLSEGDIPSLSTDKITSGQFADSRIASASTWNAKQSALTVNPSTTSATLTGLGINGINYKVEGGVTGVKGNSESSYRTGNVNLTAANIGLGDVENKSSATIRSEITTENIPSLDASKIVSGTFSDARIASASTWNNKSVVSGTNDGVNWTSVTINGVSKDIPQGTVTSITAGMGLTGSTITSTGTLAVDTSVIQPIIASHTVEVSTTWSYDSVNDVYYQDISISGIPASSTPWVDAKLSGTKTEMLAQLQEYKKILSVCTLSVNTLRIIASSETTSVINLLVKA